MRFGFRHATQMAAQWSSTTFTRRFRTFGESVVLDASGEATERVGGTVNNDERVDDLSRRSFVKKAAYVTPVIVTLDAIPSFASYGSTDRANGNNGVGNGIDPQPPGNPPINDGPGTSPGSPGAAGRGRGRGGGS